MNVRFVRAIDSGRNCAIAGMLAGSLLAGAAMTHDLPRVSLTMPAAAAMPVPEQAMEQGLPDLPLPIAPPPVVLGMATLPTLEQILAMQPPAEVPALKLPVIDLALLVPATASEPPPLTPDDFSPAVATIEVDEVVDEARPLHGRLSRPAAQLRRQVMSTRVTNASELTRLFEAHDYTLDQARRGEPVPPLQIDRVPADLGAVKDGNERKTLFITALLPIVLEANERIMAERDHVMRLYERHRAGRSLNTIERMWLAEVADRYGTDPADFVELLKRVDAVPPSMAIAQAGVESGWGTSYAARVGNSLFGQIQPSGRHAVSVPWKPGPAMPQPFSTVSDSVEAYFRNLNTHFAYRAFRAERARLRKAGKEPDGHYLIGQLVRYSELGHGYIRFVRAVIRENRLSDFDRARLPPI
jgi:Bax protein